MRFPGMGLMHRAAAKLTQGARMSTSKESQQSATPQDGELDDSQLDSVSGGQGPAVQKMEPIVVTAKRQVASAPPVQHMEPIVVVGIKPAPSLEGAQLASVATQKKG
jgi:hypothetical protein